MIKKEKFELSENLPSEKEVAVFMREQEVIYRAKRKYNNGWVEGYYAKAKDCFTGKDVHIIFPLDLTLYPRCEVSSYEEIIPETLGRLLRHPCYDSDYTEERFFQGDIIAVWHRYDDISVVEPEICLVIDESAISENGLGFWFPQDTTRVKIIGNVYDNPELLDWRDKNHIMFDSITSRCPDDYLDQHKRLTKKYDIHGAHAACYICNFENDYFCHQYNGGCDKFDQCCKIREDEENS